MQDKGFAHLPELGFTSICTLFISLRMNEGGLSFLICIPVVVPVTEIIMQIIEREEVVGNCLDPGIVTHSSLCFVIPVQLSTIRLTQRNLMLDYSSVIHHSWERKK